MQAVSTCLRVVGNSRDHCYASKDRCKQRLNGSLLHQCEKVHTQLGTATTSYSCPASAQALLGPSSKVSQGLPQRRTLRSPTLHPSQRPGAELVLKLAVPPQYQRSPELLRAEPRISSSFRSDKKQANINALIFKPVHSVAAKCPPGPCKLCWPLQWS